MAARLRQLSQEDRRPDAEQSSLIGGSNHVPSVDEGHTSPTRSEQVNGEMEKDSFLVQGEKILDQLRSLGLPKALLPGSAAQLKRYAETGEKTWEGAIVKSKEARGFNPTLTAPSTPDRVCEENPIKGEGGNRIALGETQEETVSPQTKLPPTSETLIARAADGIYLDTDFGLNSSEMGDILASSQTIDPAQADFDRLFQLEPLRRRRSISTNFGVEVPMTSDHYESLVQHATTESISVPQEKDTEQAHLPKENTDDVVNQEQDAPESDSTKVDQDGDENGRKKRKYTSRKGRGNNKAAKASKRVKTAKAASPQETLVADGTPEAQASQQVVEAQQDPVVETQRDPVEEVQQDHVEGVQQDHVDTVDVHQADNHMILSHPNSQRFLSNESHLVVQDKAYDLQPGNGRGPGAMIGLHNEAFPYLDHFGPGPYHDNFIIVNVQSSSPYTQAPPRRFQPPNGPPGGMPPHPPPPPAAHAHAPYPPAQDNMGQTYGPMPEHMVQVSAMPYHQFDQAPPGGMPFGGHQPMNPGYVIEEPDRHYVPGPVNAPFGHQIPPDQARPRYLPMAPHTGYNMAVPHAQPLVHPFHMNQPHGNFNGFRNGPDGNNGNDQRGPPQDPNFNPGQC